MIRHVSKWAFLGEHTFSSLAGFFRELISRPLFAFKLLRARATFFFKRELRTHLETPDQYVIESTEELVSYWSLFIERECGTKEWKEALVQERQPIVLDVGANAGLFSHLIWNLRREAEIIIFEPLPKMAGKIASWGERTGARMTLHNKAVSDHCGTATFYASAENDPTASLKPEGAKSLKLDVPIVTLDSIVPERPIFLAKIDVEGCECEVLAGGVDTISRTRFLIVEAHTKEALVKIRRQLGDGWYGKKVGASDYFFTRKSN